MSVEGRLPSPSASEQRPENRWQLHNMKGAEHALIPAGDNAFGAETQNQEEKQTRRRDIGAVCVTDGRTDGWTDGRSRATTCTAAPAHTSHNSLDLMGTRQAAATTRNVRGSFPDKVTGYFNGPIPSRRVY
jgi:hypothetical protein